MRSLKINMWKIATLPLSKIGIWRGEVLILKKYIINEVVNTNKENTYL